MCWSTRKDLHTCPMAERRETFFFWNGQGSGWLRDRSIGACCHARTLTWSFGVGERDIDSRFGERWVEATYKRYILNKGAEKPC